MSSDRAPAKGTKIMGGHPAVKFYRNVLMKYHVVLNSKRTVGLPGAEKAQLRSC